MGRIGLNQRDAMRWFWARSIDGFEEDDDVREGAWEWYLGKFSLETL